MSDFIDLCDYAVEYGKKNGVQYVEARYIKSSDENYVTRNGMFISIQDKKRQGIGIRVLADGGIGFGSTEELNKDSIEALLNRITKMAKLSKRKEPILFSEEKSVETNWESPVAIDFKDISIEDKKMYIKSLDKRLKKEVGRDLKNRISIIMLYSEQKYISNSDGSKILSKKSLPSIYAMTTAKGKTGSEQRMFGQGGSGGWEWFNESKLGDLMVEDGKSLVNAAKNAVYMQFNEPIDVIVSGEVSGIMSHENVGHPSEADRILGREGAQAGESFYKDLWKGEFEGGKIKIGNEQVNVIDDPTIPNSPGFYLYDEECVKARPRYLIKDGMLNDLLLNREFAHKMGTKSNASSRAIHFDREPLIRMANTYFGPGDFNSIDELVEDVKKGLYMKSFTEWNIDDRRFQSKYVGLEAYLIENGKLTNVMVKRPILELTTFGIFGSVDGATKDYYAPYGSCGKSDPMQGVPVAIGGSTVRLREIRVGSGGVF